MRFSCVALLAAICAIYIADAVPVEEHQHEEHTVASPEFLDRYKRVLTLFYYINQDSHLEEHLEIVKSYNPEEHADCYTKPEVLTYFVEHYYHHDMLQRGEVFSIFHVEHQRQAKALFEVFYYAKDFDTFYKTAVVARNHLNQGLFLYAYSVALVHRPDTQGMILPPIYEVHPHYFYPTETIYEAQKQKQMYHQEQHNKAEEDNHGYTVVANYSGHYLNLHPEQSLSYFTEDVGVNAAYYYYSIVFPHWMCSEEYGFDEEHRGVFFYYFHRQLLAHYYMERLSNGFGEIPHFDYDTPFETGYCPSLQYENGLEFPTRPNFANLHEYFYNYGQSFSFKHKYGYSHTAVHTYERRILDAIDSGYAINEKGEHVDIYTKEGFNILANLIEGNHDSIHHSYYGGYITAARHLLGYAPQPLDYHHVAASALEHYETSLRDPAFYQLFKKIMLYFAAYKYHLDPYTKSEIQFEGVKVTEVEIDHLVTFFEKFYSDITNAVYASPEDFDDYHFRVRAVQERLSHKPFTYKVHVHSDKDVKATVRVYMAPKYDEYEREIPLAENYFNFVQFDHFVYDLKTGDNVLTRDSHHNYFYGDDAISYRQLFKSVMKAAEGHEEFHIPAHSYHHGFPRRYLLPKGTHDGLDVVFYVVVSPYVEHHSYHEDAEHHHHGVHFLDGYPLGYPFERPVYHQHPFHCVDNIYHFNAKIHHSDVEEVNSPHH